MFEKLQKLSRMIFGTKKTCLKYSCSDWIVVLEFNKMHVANYVLEICGVTRKNPSGGA